MSCVCSLLFFFSFGPAPTAIYTLSLHDALPISILVKLPVALSGGSSVNTEPAAGEMLSTTRSEEHTSELQSLTNLVCRLLLEKKKLPTMLEMLLLKMRLLPTLPVSGSRYATSCM